MTGETSRTQPPRTQTPRTQTFGADLLAIARKTLQEEIAPHLSGDQRYQAAMVANACAIAAREMETAPAARQAEAACLEAARAPSPTALCAAIRSGARDADPLLHAALLRLSLIATYRTRPGALRPAERGDVDALIEDQTK
ncbi:MAG TPA: DUF6285 domain-containing protein [Xanthobacteraceae bacterium]|jgi:hypothetical protein|nr:DUF6285 domain-containing protein [Xanthobacteraceae bacterium]HQS48269.1 DUF6285 domain-containing protein [Xanthobacteraceae bacterium]